MRLVAVVFVLVLVLCVTGCGNARRKAVTEYINQVDAVEVGLRVPLAQVAQANRRFSTRANLAALAPQLVRAEQTMRTLGRRLATLQPPSDATQLAALLTKLVAAETRLVAQTHRTAVFLPAFRSELAGLGPVGSSFRRSLGTAKTARAEAAVLARYAHGIDAPLAQLRKLDPPPILRPTYAAQIRTLTRTRTTSLALAAALHARHAAKAHALIEQLARIGVSSGSLAAQRAQIAAVNSYNAQVGRVGDLSVQVQNEVERLQRQLG